MTRHNKGSNGHLYLKTVTRNTSIQCTYQTTHAHKDLSHDIIFANLQDMHRLYGIMQYRIIPQKRTLLTV